jgi:hypothetical protein
MSENEYKELIDFLGKKFERIDERFEKIDNQFESVNKKIDNVATDVKDLRREMGVLYEDVQHRFDLVGEGMTAMRQGFDKDKDENEQEHARLEKMTLVNLADISKLDQRVGRLEEKI